MISKNETYELLTLISEFYDRFEITQSRIDAWHLVLKGFEFEKIKENLLRYCRENKYPPKVADLIKVKVLDRINAIPDVKETRIYLESIIRKTEYTDEEKQSIEQSKEKIKKNLGIG
jgi:hypothetical protein